MEEHIGGEDRSSKETEDDQSGEAGYCVCNEPATEPNTMVTCNDCHKGFHISCVLSEDADINLLVKYICDECHEKTGNYSKWRGKGKKKRKQDETHMEITEKKDRSPKRAREDPNNQSISPTQEKRQPKQEPVRRSLRTKVKHNYSELNDGAEQEVSDKSIVVDYVKMLKKANCVKSDSIPLKMRGEDLTTAFLSQNGFREPLLVDGMESLDMKMPPSTITVHRIKELVGMFFTI
jgi:PHD-finger